MFQYLLHKYEIEAGVLTECVYGKFIYYILFPLYKLQKKSY